MRKLYKRRIISGVKKRSLTKAFQKSKGKIVRAQTLKAEGKKAIGFAHWTALTVGLGSGLTSAGFFRRLLDVKPQTLREALLQASILAASAGAVTVGVGAAQYGLGSIKAGRQIKKLKPLVWGSPKRAKLLVNKLHKLNVERKTLNKIMRWGRRKG